MDSLNVSQLANKLSQESDVPSEDERDTSPIRKQNKSKQKRKVSTVSLRGNGKTKNR